MNINNYVKEKTGIEACSKYYYCLIMYMYMYCDTEILKIVFEPNILTKTSVYRETSIPMTALWCPAFSI